MHALRYARELCFVIREGRVYSGSRLLYHRGETSVDQSSKRSAVARARFVVGRFEKKEAGGDGRGEVADAVRLVLFVGVYLERNLVVHSRSTESAFVICEKVLQRLFVLCICDGLTILLTYI